ncbi:MAG: filamentous hemagglutinin N-terminal domain-containing protein [Acetobacteraceae bacterium]|nr:filamentous hemagglutinin N-terminal domain-containing protein [Acetobacteraceae bacterium]
MPRTARRSDLLRSTALQAAAVLTIANPVQAQPAPNAQPQGGKVVAGSATIARTPGTTAITQTTDRAAIDWRSFDVGRNQAVTFQQPSASSATLNRVTGPDPSAIAGRISANGQIILTNPNGVTFFQGAQVNAQSVIVSAPGITTHNFMAGRMVFDRPANPRARIENAGTITVKQAGLAALVAPSVANSGTITAHLGHVVLAGAAAATLDMYGDGLVSIDVTKQVQQAPVGPGGKPVTALVTNTGTIAADGGTIQLSARAADGVVQSLVDAGGTIRANTVGTTTGQIEIAGTGGSVVIDGRVAADGHGGGHGGTIVLNGSAATILADTAHVTANGAAGGGTVAIGTTLARARTTGPAPATTSARTTIAPGARVSASAGKRGNGGRVTVLSTASTTVAGTIEAKGGAVAGNGGTIELSGETGFRLTGHADTSAPHGTAGTILLDPRDLTIAVDPPSAGTPNQPLQDNTDPNIAADAGGVATDAYVTPLQLKALTGNLHVLTTRDLTVTNGFSYNGGSVTLEAGRNLTVSATAAAGLGSSGSGSGTIILADPGVTASGDLNLFAASSAIAGYDPTGALSIAAPLSGPTVTLSAGTGGIALSANVTAGTAVLLNTTGPVSQTGGTLTTPQLSGTAASVNLPAANAIDGIGNRLNAPLTTTAGGVLVTEAQGQFLTVGTPQGGGGISVPTGQTVTLSMDSLSLAAPVGGKAITASTVVLQPSNSDLSILVSATFPDGPALVVTPAELSLLAVNTLQLGSRALNGNVTIGQTDEAIDFTAAGIPQLVLSSHNNIDQGGPLTVASLNIQNTGAATLSNTGNRFDTLTIGTNGPSTLTTAGNLTIAGNSGADNLTIIAGGSITEAAGGTLSASDSITLSAGDRSVPGYDPAASLTVLNRTGAANTLSLSAGTGGIVLGPSLSTDLVISTTGTFGEGPSGISTTTLSGTAGSANLPSPTNSIQAISTFNVTGTGGSFVLVLNDGVSIGNARSPGGITTQAGGLVSITSDHLSLNAPAGGTAINAPGGTVALTPYTPTIPIVLSNLSAVGEGAPTVLTITQPELARISASQLTLGSIGGARAAQSGPIVLGNPSEAIDLTALGLNTLGLNTTGAVTQGGPLAVPAVTGTVGSLSLALAGNQISRIAEVTANSVALHTDGSLTVGNLTVGGDIALSSAGPDGMTLSGAISGQSINLNSLSSSLDTPTPTDPVIFQTDGTITAASLGGAAGYASLSGSNAIGTLGDFVTYSGLVLNTRSALTITGSVSSTTGYVSLTAAGLQQASGSRLVTPELDGASLGDTVLTNASNVVGGVGSFTQPSGNFALTTAGSQLVLGRRGGQLQVAAGSATLVADGLSVDATERSGPAVSVTQGALTVTPYTPGRPIELIGQSVADPSSLSLDAALTGSLDVASLVLAAPDSPVKIGNAGDTVDFGGRVGTLVLGNVGPVTEGSNARFVVPTLSGSAPSVVLGSAANGIGAVSDLHATDGPIAVRSSSSLSAQNVSATDSLQLASAGTLVTGGSLTGTAIDLSGSLGISQNGGQIATPANLTLSAQSGPIIQSGGSMTATTLAARSTALSLPGANSFDSASIAVTGTVLLNDTVSLTLLALTGTNASIATAADLDAAGAITVSDTLSLSARGAISQSAGIITANQLSGSAASAGLTGPNAIATLGAFSTTGDLVLGDASSLAVIGPVSGANITLSTNAGLVLSGALTTPGTLAMHAAGELRQTSGSLSATTLTGSAATASLDQTGNRVTTLAGFATSGDFSYTNGGDLTVAGPVDPNTVSLTVDGKLTVASTITASNIVLTATGDIVEWSGGQLVAGTLSGSAASAALTRPNQLDTVGAFSTQSGFALVSTLSLTLTGPLSDQRTGIALSAPAITLAGPLFAPALALSSPGAVVQTAGNLLVATLAGSVGSLDLGSLSPASFETLGPLTATKSIAINDQVPLRIAGPLAAPLLSVASTGSLVLDNGQIRTDGQPLATQVGAAPAPGGSNFAVRPGASGAANFVQTGTTSLDVYSRGIGTLRIDLLGTGGTMTFEDLQASHENLVLSLGNGTASGTLQTNSLTVLGRGGRANLEGQIGDRSDSSAAQLGKLLPGSDLRYTFNACVIAAPSCSAETFGAVTLPAAAVSSILRPDILTLGILDLSVTRDRDDPTLLLPNISDRDY